MATFNKINSFTLNLAQKVYNLGTDNLKIALTNTPHTSTWTKLADLTEVSYTNCSSRAITITSSTQTAGVYKLVLQDLTLTASGAVGPFEYIYLYDDSATNKELIGYYDYGSALTLQNGDTLLLDFDGVNGVLTIT